MRFVRLAGLAVLMLHLPAGVAAQESDIVVSGGVYRQEIERILSADNVDTSQLPERRVAEIMVGIERGRAPDDFWAAYSDHVDAWVLLANAIARARREPNVNTAEAVDKAEQAIIITFDRVERIARRYRARMPTPPWKIAPTAKAEFSPRRRR
jgi:hypothetical protein